MPIYEYECLNCGKTAEAMQRFSDPPLTECSHCKGRLRKLISMSTFHLKGSGWYTTDYCGKNQSTSKQTECKPEGCKSESCAKKPESSPASPAPSTE
ncbi:MAG: FmdB family zinc ribbon protein [Syntrophobacter sp.]